MSVGHWFGLTFSMTFRKHPRIAKQKRVWGPKIAGGNLCMVIWKLPLGNFLAFSQFSAKTVSAVVVKSPKVAEC